ncbi:hypothetical protein HanRHA438_Chr16g0745721 [Helianthus annuus]|uniref:Uncharacterized protein n=1 Tax=Helianthus annuus TaxID=4232 RepID=A0A9K3DNT8_HELAN|nr:UPF0496 protein At4g34320-like [Helianthus annuus]KAF5758776.1 hypothetical protein HanXRQr2_Chr16g0733241 [Helianthus annuus]KAJ0437069.1 hypothetical protein HanHA300_Chr16g0597841 [Helianthus annuus]KAJ0441421.1 hypothetical protein HanIR_Chr16g0797531 [Helianthus annuus]KAJ0459379.1 hypothetical protein HanHA89_Chr16g0648301 [Helianthus annuus]KAJ0643869.1 hypothetical protein HanOQP8_Chr16g0605401 [Helianthus annuus]
MGAHVSKKHASSATSSSSSISLKDTQHIVTELNAYEAVCRSDTDLQSFDTTLHARANNVINTLAVGVEVRALSFETLKEVTECLLEMNQEVVKVILHCKKDIWKNQELFELVEEYFENSLQTVDFCSALDKCLKRVRGSQLLILVALQHFDEDEGVEENRYEKTLEDLKSFKDAGDPFTEEFYKIFYSVYRQQMVMLEKLQSKKTKLDKKMKYIQTFRKVSSVIFVATFAAVLICSVVAAAIAAPPVAAALAAATSIPLGSTGKWINSLLKNYENVIKGQKEIISSMQVGGIVAIRDLDSIRVLVDRLQMDIEELMKNAGHVIEGDEMVKVAIDEIKIKLNSFMKNVDDLGTQADNCSRDVRRARTVVLQRIIKPPHH